MGYTNVALKDKIMEMYPEITQHNISASLDFDEEKNSYKITLRKDLHKLETYLDKSDADECMDGMKCVSLGIRLGEFIRNFESQ